MLRIVALLSIAARCAAFGSTFSTSSSGACIDEPAHLIAEETAKLGGEFAQYTSCDGIAAAGGCGVAIVKVVCCATCADVRDVRAKNRIRATNLQLRLQAGCAGGSLVGVTGMGAGNNHRGGG